MEMKEIILLFLVIIILIFGAEGVHIIPNESEINVPSGANFKLECFGSDVLNWLYPSDNIDGTAIKNITNSKLNGHLESTLQLNGMTYMDTGYYECYSDQILDERARIYVYVNDVNHLLVYNELNSYLTIMQYEPFFIPCRPTFKNVQVTLLDENLEQIDQFHFDPHNGFLVNNPKLRDSGLYYCRASLPTNTNASQEVTFTVQITPTSEDIKKPKIIFHGEKTGTHVMIGEKVVLECSVTVSLGVHVVFNWITPLDKFDNSTIFEQRLTSQETKINGLTVKLYKSSLILDHVNKDFDGLYKCFVMDHSNNTNQDEYLLQVHSEDASYLNLTMEGENHVIVRSEGNKAEWIVKIIAHPIPEIIWYDPNFKKLPSDSKKYNIIHDGYSSKVIIYDARMKDSGYYEMQAKNTAGTKSLKVYLSVEDIPQVTISIDEFYLKNENYKIKCTVLAEPRADIYLSFTPDDRPSKVKKMSVYSPDSKTVAKDYIGELKAEQDGNITCTATNRYGTSSNTTRFIVTDAKAPVFSEEFMKENKKYMRSAVGELVRWRCVATGLPKPQITWEKDGKILKTDDNSTIKISRNNETLEIPMRTNINDGEYTCIASNIAGKITRKFTLQMSIEMSMWYWVVAVILILSSVCIASFIFLFRRVLHEKKLRERITAAGLYYFQEGQIESLNPDLSIGEQADLLPYDKRWEVPREKIKLGIQLGSGAFGVVMKGEVQGLKVGESSTTVAVKMVKKNSDFSLVKALVSELKIMSHLGQHLNVVNLLGACTSGIYNGEVLVLVEYCKHGNLHNYLLKHREDFINQVNPHSGNLDLMNSYNDSKNSNTYVVSNSEIYVGASEYNGVQSADTEMTTLYSPPSVAMTDDTQPPQSPVGEDGYLISRPFTREKENSKNKCITTKDLICWSYQVARGMEYLASRKVLHGDLATRNILLAEGNIVKICDFGFSKSMYHDDNYTKKGNVPLPLKWLSIEALRDRVFSTQSDIWAYGIVLWEIFTLAKTPYPGKQFDQQLFDSLVEGYRMEKPDFATEDVYNLMLECWKEQPMLRPSFTECADRLANMLEESVVQHYMELNDPYMQFNAMATETDDYLNRINSPIYSNFCSNTSNTDSDGGPPYLNMSKTQQQDMEMKPMIPQDTNQ